MLSYQDQDLEGKSKISSCGFMPVTRTNPLGGCSLIQQIHLKARDREKGTA